MSHTWSKSALALHELGLAASFGGLLFAKTGLDPAVKVIPDERDRGRVLNAATAAYTIPGSIALAGAALAWLIGRSAISGRALGPGMRRLVLFKDICVGLTLAAGATKVISGVLFASEAEGGGVPVDTGLTTSPAAPEKARTLQRTMAAAGLTEMVAAGAALATTSVLNFNAGRSSRWSAIASVLP